MRDYALLIFAESTKAKKEMKATLNGKRIRMLYLIHLCRSQDSKGEKNMMQTLIKWFFSLPTEKVERGDS